MTDTIIMSIIGALIIGTIMVIISVRKALKNPEEFQKQSDVAYEKLNNIKTSVTGNSLSWEEAKKQAAAQIELENQIKTQKKVERLAKKQKKD